MISHILKFAGLLCLLSLLVKCQVPFGGIVGSAIVMLGLWKLVE